MAQYLVFQVRLHDGRYHGTGDWPPTSARFFQALVAAAGLGGPLAPEVIEALKWLEAGEPPTVAAPFGLSGRGVGNFVPNNDLDAQEGDPRNIGAIRTKKVIKPRFFDAGVPFIYAWPLADGAGLARHFSALSAMADGLYQLGRGVDLAWATLDEMDEATLEALLKAYRGTVHRATLGGGGGLSMACPQRGSFASLDARYKAQARRFTTVQAGRAISQTFRQAPKPRFRQVAYDSPPARQLYELRHPDRLDQFAPWPLTAATELVKLCRDAAVEKLTAALPADVVAIERWLIGRRPGDPDSGASTERVRLAALPSIGVRHADQQIRRLLIEVPAACPVRMDDLRWAFNGLPVGAGEGPVLVAGSDVNMLEHYAPAAGSRRWWSVTPLALPENAGRRRIDPLRRQSGRERGGEQQATASAVLAALRHASISVRVEHIRLQREPFARHGERVEAFADGGRFHKERLWHVEIEFASEVQGPLIVGDGRFCGLGLMAPADSLAGG